MGDGTVNLQRLLGNFLLAVGRQVFERPHIVQAVSQLDHDHADVVHHGEHHLAQVLRLLLFLGREINFADFCDTLDDVSHLLAKFLADIDDGHRGVFHRIVQQPGRHRDRIHLHLGEHQGNFQGMHEVGLARGATLPGMHVQRIIVGFFDEFQIVRGPIGLHPLHQVAEARDREDIGCDLFAQSRHVGL